MESAHRALSCIHCSLVTAHCYTVFMEQLARSISLVTGRRDGNIAIAVSGAALFVLLLLVGTKSFWSGGTIILAMLGSFLSGINFSLAYVYIRNRKDVLLESLRERNVGFLLACLRVGGTVCGIAFLSIVLSFLGFSTMLTELPLEGQDLGYIGLIIILIGMYVLARKVTDQEVW